MRSRILILSVLITLVTQVPALAWDVYNVPKTGTIELELESNPKKSTSKAPISLTLSCNYFNKYISILYEGGDVTFDTKVKLLFPLLDNKRQFPVKIENMYGLMYKFPLSDLPLSELAKSKNMRINIYRSDGSNFVAQFELSGLTKYKKKLNAQDCGWR
jgi:hypothetical protein